MANPDELDAARALAERLAIRAARHEAKVTSDGAKYAGEDMRDDALVASSVFLASIARDLNTIARDLAALASRANG